MIERTVLPETSRSTPGLRLPERVGVSPQFVQFALIVLGITLITFIMYLYVLPNSQINQAHTRIAQLQAQKAELQRRNAEVLQEIARNSDLKILEIRAHQLGMGPVQSAVYLHMPDAGIRESSDRNQQADVAASRNDEPAAVDRPLTLETIEKQANQVLNGAVQSVDGFLSRLLGD